MKIRKLLCLFLCVIMSASAFAVTAFAGNGPSDYYDEYEGEKYYLAFLNFQKIDEYGDPIFGEGSYFQVFSDNTVKNEMPNAKYDLATNTLTITDLNAPDCILIANMMGDDFKIVVKGTCSVASMLIYGDAYGGSLSIEGDGTLTINETKASYYAILLIPEGASSLTFNLGKDVKVNMYSGTDSNYVAAIYAAEKDFDPAVSVKFGDAAPTLTKERVKTSYGVAGYLEDYEGTEGGYKCTAADDPDGYYVYSEWFSFNPETGEYDLFSYIEVIKYIYSPTFDCYFPDHEYHKAHSPDNDFSGIRFTSREDFENSIYTPVYDDNNNTVYTTFNVPNRMYSTSQPVYIYRSATGDEQYIIYTDYSQDYKEIPCKVVEIPEVEGEYLFRPDETVKVDDLEEVMVETDNYNYFLTGDSYSYPSKFSDVTGTEWFGGAALWCDEHGYMNGLDATHFGPKNQVTRAQFVLILAKIAEVDLDADEYSGTSFTDVPTGKWYSRAVEWAYKNGFSSGLGNGVFGVNSKVTREQLATFFATYAKKALNVDTAPKDPTVLDRFTDKDKISGWAKDAVGWAVEAGIISGTSETTVSPKAVATRAQIAVIVQGFVEKIVEPTLD